MNGHPSRAGPLNAGSVPAWASTRVAGDQSENPVGMATAVAVPTPAAATRATAMPLSTFMSNYLLDDEPARRPPTAADPQSKPRSTVSATAAPTGARPQRGPAALARLNMAPGFTPAVERRSS